MYKRQVLEQVYEKSIPVISYDQLIMDTDKVNYYVTFNTRKAGKMVGDSIIKNMALEKAREEKKTLTIEFLMGSPDAVSYTHLDVYKRQSDRRSQARTC